MARLGLKCLDVNLDTAEGDTSGTDQLLALNLVIADPCAVSALEIAYLEPSVMGVKLCVSAAHARIGNYEIILRITAN